MADVNRVDAIFLDLERRILGGELAPGDRLPSERELASWYRTNRNTLREALIRLEVRGLIRVRHGQGATVIDFRRHAHLDILPAFLEHAARPEEQLQALADLLPARVEVLCVAARFACLRGTAEDHTRLRALAATAVAAFELGARPPIVLGYQAWLEAFIDAAHSLPTRWIANSLLPLHVDVALKYPELWIIEPSFPAHLREVGGAVEGRDINAAVASFRRYFARVDAILGPLLDPEIVRFEEGSP